MIAHEDDRWVSTRGDMKTYDSEAFRLTLGRHSGYGTPEERPDDYTPMHRIAATWRRLMEEEAGRTGIYISALFSPAKAVYALAHGCPPGGEPIAVIEGTRNPFYCADGVAWALALTRLVGALKCELGQITCQLDIIPCRTSYFAAED